MEFPVWAYLTCAEVFKKTGDEERRRKSIEDGYILMMNRAQKFSDPNWKRNYIEEVPEHLVIVQSREKLNL